MKTKKCSINFPLEMVKDIEVHGAEEIRDFGNMTKILIKEALNARKA